MKPGTTEKAAEHFNRAEPFNCSHMIHIFNILWFWALADTTSDNVSVGSRKCDGLRVMSVNELVDEKKSNNSGNY